MKIFSRTKAVILIFFVVNATLILSSNAQDLPDKISKKYQDVQYTSRNAYPAVKLNGKWGCIDEKGNEILPEIYEAVSPTSKETIWVKQNGKWGVLNQHRQVVVPISFDNMYFIGDFNHSVIVVSINGKYGLYSTGGKKLTELIYQPICRDERGYIYPQVGFNLIPVRLDNKYGYISMQGKVIIPFKYQQAGTFYSPGMATVALNGYFGCINTKGEIVVPFKYDEIENFDYGIAQVRKNLHLGWINIHGQVVVPIEYDDAKNYFSLFRMTTIKKDGKWGAIDTDGRIIIPVKYDDPIYYEGNISTDVKVNGKNGRLNFAGKEIIHPKYDSIHTAPGGVELNRKWAVIDKEGNEITPFVYDWAGYAGEKQKATTVKLNNKMGLVSTVTGKQLTEIKYNSIGFCNAVKFIFGYGGKFGIVDDTGKEIVPAKYDSLTYYYQLRVLINKKWGFIDINGNVIIEPQYQQVGNFELGVVAVEKNNKWGLVDKTNKVLIPFMYQKMISTGSTAIVCLNNKWGIVNKHNKIVIPITYTYKKLMEKLDAEADETGD